jgi:hypothetical protein
MVGNGHYHSDVITGPCPTVGAWTWNMTTAPPRVVGLNDVQSQGIKRCCDGVPDGIENGGMLAGRKMPSGKLVQQQQTESDGDRDKQPSNRPQQLDCIAGIADEKDDVLSGMNSRLPNTVIIIVIQTEIALLRLLVANSFL